MTQEKFTKTLIEVAGEKTPEYRYEYEPELVDKDGSIHIGFRVIDEKAGEYIGMSMDGAYEDMKEWDDADIPFDLIANGMIQNIREAFNEIPVQEHIKKCMTDYEEAKNHLVLEVISAEANADALLDVPYRIVGDMAIVYGVLIWMDEIPLGSVRVDNMALNEWGITKEQLHEDALKSSPKERPGVLVPWEDFIGVLNGGEIPDMSGPNGEDVTILFGTSMIGRTKDEFIGMESGAAVIMYPGYLELVADKLGESFYIAPIDSAQLLFFPESTAIPMDNIKSIMNNARGSDDDPGGVVTDRLYFYDKNTGVMETLDYFGKEC